MIAVDSSVAVAGFGSWHQLNEAACSVLDEGAAVPAHALLETYSVLTGFPQPYRAAADVARTWLDDRFAGRVLEPPSAAAQHDLLRTLAGGERTGGAVYDALVALTSKLAGATLATADTRALPIYELVGVQLRWVGPAASEVPAPS